MWRHIASNALSLFVVVLIALGGLLAWGKKEFVAQGPLQQAMCFKVKRGATIGVVSKNLASVGAVSNPMIFRLGADYSEQAAGLKFGSYELPPGASMSEILDLMTEGGPSTCGVELNYRIGVLKAEMVIGEPDPATNQFVELVKFEPGVDPTPADYATLLAEPDLRMQVTVAEGATSWQVVEALKRADFLTGELGEVPAEGSLAPAGYEVTKGEERAALLVEMAELQGRILSDLWAGRADGLPITTPEEALVLASIIEKETGVPEERGRVASIFVNRLNQKMKLQTDPAVIYGITKGQGALGRGLRQSELRKATPYNTYVIDGLPPTPIANPGALSIEAALNPDTTDYLFFVADGTGGHAFATNLTDHEANVEKWRAIEAQQGEADTATGVQGE